MELNNHKLKISSIHLTSNYSSNLFEINAMRFNILTGYNHPAYISRVRLSDHSIEGFLTISLLMRHISTNNSSTTGTNIKNLMQDVTGF